MKIIRTIPSVVALLTGKSETVLAYHRKSPKGVELKASAEDSKSDGHEAWLCT